MRKILYFIFSLILTIVVGCQENSTKTGESDYDSSAFHIALLPVEECQPFLLAEQYGLYDSLGINVQIHEYNAAMDADTALMNGFVSMEVSDSVKMDILQTQCDSTDSIVCVMKDHLALSLIMSNKARVKNIKNVKEKIVAMTRNSSLDYFANKITEEAGLKHEELNRPQINNIRLRTQMLLQDQYDGAILPEPWATQCVDSGATRVTTSDKIQPLQFFLIVKSSVNKKHKSDIGKIKEAYQLAKKRAESQKSKAESPKEKSTKQ